MLVTTERPLISQPVSLTTTVPKEYVHRASLSEVFLTGWHESGPDAFTVTAQWPRSHSFYSSRHAVHDPLLLCETIRQTFPLLTHAAYGMPFGHQLSWSHFQYAVNPQAMQIERSPAELELRIQCRDIRYLRSVPASMSMSIEVLRNGGLLALASTRFGCHTPKVYERLRGGHEGTSRASGGRLPPGPVPYTVAGRDRPEDVVLAATTEPRRWQLRVDTEHPVLFDHPVDHVPGMLLLESVRQAAHALDTSQAPVMLTAMDVTFNRYVEYDEACWIEGESVSPVAASARRSVRVNARQSDALAFTATADLTDF
ncbi:transcriptional regulator [Streptomyces lunaelactis]|nr:transcriptional regulator [Streptomyces lunaelactis]NUK82323.1 transcriptional regulator [Streptomyces lunaelactis]